MAHIVGSAGEHSFRQHRQRFLKAIFAVVLAMAISAGAYGFALRSGVLWSLAILPVLAILMWLAYRLADRFLDEGRAYRKGATGEMLVADELELLPDVFWVFHDVHHQSLGGNVDHLVVGPTGIFALETKNWDGIVCITPAGELLLNGKPVDKNYPRTVYQNAMQLKEKIATYVPKTEVFVQAALVFPHTFVDKSGGTSRSVDMKRLEELETYLKAERRAPRALTREQVAEIAKYLKPLVQPAK